MNDAISAITDAIHLRAGLLSERDAHPHAPALANGERGKLLPALADIFADRQAVRGGLQSRALVSSDLGNVLSDLVRVAAVQSVHAHAGHRLFCKELPVKNFNEHSFPNFDFGIDMEEVHDGGEVRGVFDLIDLPGVTAKLRTFGTLVRISRPTIVNDDIQLIAQVGTSAGAIASRREAVVVYGTLESNPNLSDGGPMFHGDYGNLIGSVLNSTSFAAALAATRNMKTAAGEPADLPARHLICATDLEVAARTLRRSASLDTELTVIPSPWLAAGHWYVGTDPALSTTLAITHLEHSRGLTVTIAKAPIEFDGIGLKITTDFGVVPVGRLGLVRGHA